MTTPSIQSPHTIGCYSHRLTNQKAFELLTQGDISQQRILDVGAGEGFFCSLLGDYLKKRYSISPSKVLTACDLYPENFRYFDVPCDRIDLRTSLPYPDDSFDSVSCIEVIEHIEDQFQFVRELHRITKPGGRVIVTTPNLLNVNSRIRFLHSGFWLLFNPLPLRRKDPVRLAGHIHPVTFYYLAHIFHSCGFGRVTVHFDKSKRSAAIWLGLLYLFISMGHWGFRLHLRSKNTELYQENQNLIGQINSYNMLTSRSVILEGVK